MAVDTGPVKRQEVQALVAAYLKRPPEAVLAALFLGDEMPFKTAT